MANNKDSYSDAEKEILILKATIESINSMVNYEVLSLNHNDPDSNIQFPTRSHQRLFGILLVDFLRSKIFGTSERCMDALQRIISDPQAGTDIRSLKDATEKFHKWLKEDIEFKHNGETRQLWFPSIKKEEDIEFKHNGETRQLWFPSIEKEVALKITRCEFICICGNISKHNPLGLDRQAKTIKRIFERNQIDIEQTDALLIMEDFYEQFHDDLFNYHSSSIAEFLNNIRWAIYEYLQPLYHQIQAYRHNILDNITSKYAREIFRNLMNDVRSEPCMPRFQVTKHLKIRF